MEERLHQVWELNGEAQFPKAKGRDCRKAAFRRDIVEGPREKSKQEWVKKGDTPVRSGCRLRLVPHQ